MEQNGRYVLDGNGEPVPATSLLEWAQIFEKGARVVAADQIGDVRISTVFLALDHNFGGDGPPVLWETMVFGGPLDETQERCSGSRAEAAAMHAEMVERVKASACLKV